MGVCLPPFLPSPCTTPKLLEIEKTGNKRTEICELDYPSYELFTDTLRQGVFRGEEERGRQLRLVSDDKDCTYVPRDDYCRGPGCFPPSYYRTRFAKPTPCAILGSLAATFVPLGG